MKDNAFSDILKIGGLDTVLDVLSGHKRSTDSEDQKPKAPEKDDLELAIEELARPGVTFAAAIGGVVTTSSERGLGPLLEFTNLEGVSVADKVVGKAPAMLYSLLGAKRLFAYVTTKDAIRILEAAGIDFGYETVTDVILNNERSGMCPMEKLVAGTDDPKEALDLIRKKIASGR